MIKQGLRIWGIKTIVPFLSHYIKGIWYLTWLFINDVSLSHLVEQYLFGFSAVEFVFSTFHAVLFGRKSMYISYWKGEELCFNFWKVNYLHKLLGICMLSSWLFIQIINLYQYGFVDVNFIFWTIIQYTMLFCSNCSNLGH